MSTTRENIAADQLDHGPTNTDDLGDRAKRGGAIVLGSMLVQRGIGLVCLAVIARKCDPRDFGLAGMAAILSSLLTILPIQTGTTQKKSLPKAAF